MSNSQKENTELVNCLRDERVIVKYVPKDGGMITNPKHVLYGGMAESATRTFVVPMSPSGMLVDPLTESERLFLENLMGLEYNAMSIYKKKDNFWSTNTKGTISSVVLKKGDNILDLSSPDGYIKYKILLANKSVIADSIKTLQDRPKATYQFVITSDRERSSLAKNNMSIFKQCYMEYGKVEDNKGVLKLIIETIDGRTVNRNTKLEFLQDRINDLIQTRSRLFLDVISDKYIKTKVLIKECIETGTISKRGDFYYLKKGNVPLCESNEDPTLSVAAIFLNLPKNQELKLTLEASIKK